jgi:tetratricopeptide (TPR) repeat protein
MRVALGLAPDNRFVLRSFTRLALHLGSTEKLDAPFEAWERLKRSIRTRHDPWLVAAEIATAMVIGKSPKSVKDARSLLSSRRFSPFELSELAGALGSLEIDSGALKQGRKLLSQALLEPTDNAVAQVAWTARNRDVPLLDSRHLALDLTFEARAWEHYRAREWTAAIDEAERWHLDEPFAGRPLQLATFVSAVPLADFTRSAELAKRGLDLNPDDQVIRNNLAFALASDGKWRAAMYVLDKLKLADVRKEVLIEYVATWGLIQFRQGLVEEGRALYNLAIDRAHKGRAAEDEALATLYLAREERLAGTEHADETLRRATELVKKRPLAHLKAVLSQVEATSKGAPVADVAQQSNEPLTTVPRSKPAE